MEEKLRLTLGRSVYLLVSEMHNDQFHSYVITINSASNLVGDVCRGLILICIYLVLTFSGARQYLFPQIFFLSFRKTNDHIDLSSNYTLSC